MICIEDVFTDIIARVNTDIAGKGLVAYFQFGTLREIVDNLNALSQANADKYPLVALIEPFPQLKGVSRVEARLKLRFLIATYTSRDLKADERLELNFKPVLFPIYDSFLKQVKLSEYFRVDNVKHTLINHFEIGKETLEGYDGTVFNDHIDAIELKDFEIDIKNKQCKIKNF